MTPKQREDAIKALFPEDIRLARKELAEYVKAGGKALQRRPAAKTKTYVSAAGHDFSGREYRQHCMFSEFFHKHINELAYNEGLRSYR